MRQVKIIIHPDGKIEISTDGYIGTACLERTKEILEALGDTVTKIDKPEMYLDSTVQQEERNDQSC